MSIRHHVKQLFERYPRVYSALNGVRRTLFYWWRELGARLWDARAREWERQDLESIRSFWDTRGPGIKNDFLLAQLAPFAPASVLEIGCNCGNKLYAIAQEQPEARLVGIDISALAVECGIRWLAEEGVDNVRLLPGRAEELADFSDREFDVVFSWASLIYVVPAHIEAVLDQLVRVSNKAVVLLEMQAEDASQPPLGVFCAGNWKRDYAGLLAARSGIAEVAVSWIAREIWQPGGGGAAAIVARRSASG